MKSSRWLLSTALAGTILVPGFLGAQPHFHSDLPLQQSSLDYDDKGDQPLTLKEASRNDRWLGLAVRSVVWAPDESGVYFRWKLNPSPDDLPETDPWYFVDRSASKAFEVADDHVHLIPDRSSFRWSPDGNRAAWANGGRLYVFDSGSDPTTKLILSLDREPSGLRFWSNERLHFLLEEELLEYRLDQGTVHQLTRRFQPPAEPETEAAKWLKEQQTELLKLHLEGEKDAEKEAEYRRRMDPRPPQPIPVEAGVRIRNLQLSPDGRFLTFEWRKQGVRRPTHYLNYASRSGYSEVEDARPKVGEPQDEFRMGIVRINPSQSPEDLAVTWVRFDMVPEQVGNNLILGPYWSLEGDRNVVQVVSQLHKDRWLCSVDLETGGTSILHHDHDDAWLGGPEPVSGYLQPAFLEWLPGGSLVFASEKSGWSHLYLQEPGGEVRPLTAGDWEVRAVQLSPDRSFWLIQGSREHPCDDHLYRLPARGGTLVRLTEGEGRHEGLLSPSGNLLASTHGWTIQLPDLYLSDLKSNGRTRVTRSGTDNFYTHPLVKPEVVSFPHQDGEKVWAGLYKPAHPRPEKPAVIHVHGGGHRQFSHRGWSVYGYGSHLGLINYLVGQGYFVLDLDYRGSAGFGRDYRTDIYRSMGEKDVQGAVAAVQFLAENYGVDRSRVGVYGLSYGGFFTLMALFKHPGVFAAGIANASVTDWAHYNHLWTSRVLNLPYEDSEAYRKSSPIYYSQGLADPLLIVHGLIDDNVHFQDVARLMQKLIEEEKGFEVMVYPAERHVIRSEPSRYDYVKRVAAFFERHLLK